eukprot:106591_1
MTLRFLKSAATLLLFFASMERMCTHSRNIIMYEWKDLVENPHVYSIDYSAPFLIRNGPSKTWPLADTHNLLKNLQFIFHDYGNVSFNIQTSNCSCFSKRSSLCADYVNKHTYFSTFNQEMFGKREDSLWYRHEVNHAQSKQYEPCIHKMKHFDQVVNIVKRIPKINTLNRMVTTNQNQSSITWSFNIMEQDELSTKCVDLMRMQPYFDVFNTDIYDIASIHLWFGSNNYRTTLHYDFNENIFFMLNGYKTFLLAPPSLTRFKLFPFLHESERQASQLPLDDSYLMRVKVQAGDALWLPSFWYHEPVNGDMEDTMSLSGLSYGVNFWILNRELRHYFMHNIEHFKFPSFMRDMISNALKEKSNLHQLLYFVNKVETVFCETISENTKQCHSDGGLMMSYLSGTYPVLLDIQQYHLFIGNNEDIQSNVQWLGWFIDVNTSNSKVGAMKTFGKRRETLECKRIRNQNRFDNVIHDIMDSLNKLKQLKDEQVAKIALATFIETIWFDVFKTIQWTPLVSALHFL